MSRRPIVFGVSSASSWPTLRELATCCAGRGDAIAFVYEHGDDAFFQQLKVAAQGLGAGAHEMGERPDGPPPLAERIRARIARMARRPLPPPTKFDLFRKAHAARLDTARSLLKSLKPRLVVVAEDGITGNMWLLAAAREARIPVIDCPYGYGTRRDLESALSEKLAADEMITAQGEAGAEVARRYPQWVKTGAFAGALIYPPEDILARESLGITLRDAWVIHGGLSDRVCAESRHMLDFYVAEGLPQEKLVLTGSVYCDVMHRSLETDAAARAAFRAARRIADGTIRVLISWPPSYHASRGKFCEFSSYLELSQAVLGRVAAMPEVELWVSAHPAIPAEDRQVLERSGLRFVDDYVVGLIPRCDLFVSCFSSTIRWAIAAGKPVLNYDFYGFALPDYDEAPGVLLVRSFREFEGALDRLVSDEDCYREAAGRQVAIAERYGTVDGKRFDQIHQLMNELAR